MTGLESSPKSYSKASYSNAI
ncbi:hypothetical protein BRAO375_3990022 [Bradyrhizobium sp. ORS 375]|nr:hypothetical protein BRAO375_3990022 [Bradyrhizobium sp. ORS 375]